jgi:hypothetical protein
LPVAITTDGLPGAAVGQHYQFQLVAEGGENLYVWSKTAGALPLGLDLSQDGVISGIPTQSGSKDFTVRAQDRADPPQAATKQLSLSVMPSLHVATKSLPGTRYKPYRAQLSARGGSPPHMWSSDDLPRWLNLSGDGVLSGTPPGPGSPSFTVLVTDADNRRESQELVVPITSRSLSWKSTTLWMGALSVFLPIFGLAGIFSYALAISGQHVTYLGVGLLTAMASFVSGFLVGFLFGIPKVVSSGQARLSQGNYVPSSNLAEVSDWLTKLLLGAGLVQLTRLGHPVAKLIDVVASGLQSGAAGPLSGPAKLMAGSILIAYFVLGFMTAFVVTTLWYQQRLNGQSDDELALRA